MTKELYPLHGIISIVNTPFDENGQIDVASLERGVEDRILAGVAGLIVPAVASEVDKLTTNERKLVIRSVAERTAGRLPVLGGASASSLEEVVAMTKFVVECGCVGVLVQPPDAVVHDEVALRAYFQVIVARTGVRLLMVQDLDWKGPGIPVDTIRALFEAIEAFRCLKIEVVPAGPKYSAILQATGGRLNVAGGWASTQLIEALDRGVHCFMPSAHHWIFVEILRRYNVGRRHDAKTLFERLLPVLAFTSQHIDISNQFQKLLAVRQGIFRTARLRSPRVTFDEYHWRIAGELLDLAVALHAEVGWCPVTTGA